MIFIRLLKAEAYMLIGELKNYYINYIFYNIGLLLTFVGLFYAFSEKSNVESLILLFGLVTWQMSTSALSYISYIIQDESLLGTLEQMFMTRTPVTKILLSKVIVNCIFTMVKALILFVICMFAFGVQIELLNIGVKIIPIFLIIILTVACFYAIGLVFGGLSLHYKRVQAVVNTFTYLLLFFTGITVPVSALPKIIRPVSYIIPITWSNRSIRDIMQCASDTTCYKSLGLLAIVLISYFIIGCLIFKISLNKAKKLGKLGQY